MSISLEFDTQTEWSGSRVRSLPRYRYNLTSVHTQALIKHTAWVPLGPKYGGMLMFWLYKQGSKIVFSTYPFIPETSRSAQKRKLP